MVGPVQRGAWRRSLQGRLGAAGRGRLVTRLVTRRGAGEAARRGPRGRWLAARRRHWERGQALVEAALVFPLLILLTVALLQFFLYTHAQQVVAGAVQDGARSAAAVDGTLDEGVAHAQAILRAGLGQNADEIALRAADNGDVVVLQAQGRLHTIIPWVADATLPIQARATMSKERFRPGGMP